MLGRRKREWVWVDSFPKPPKDVQAIMNRLTQLPIADAEAVLLRVIGECRDTGTFSRHLALPSEHRFMERQYTRALGALNEIAETGGEGDPAAEKARRALETNTRALAQHQEAAAGWTPPELEEFIDGVFGPDPEN
jgi:hypothetical protein